MSAPENFRVGEDRLLCDWWHAAAHTVVLRAQHPRRPLHTQSIRRVCDELADRGVKRILTAALDEQQGEPFASAGFVPHESLCVLRHDLGPTPQDRHASPALPRTRRGSRRVDLEAASKIDARAFPAPTALDHAGLAGILSATPTSRFRVIGVDDTDGYAVTGIAAMHGYLQRLAVDPRRMRHGLGRALVTDALQWLRRRRVDCALVNTQTDNVAARSLYLATGFVPTAQRLTVWTFLTGASR